MNTLARLIGLAALLSTAGCASTLIGQDDLAERAAAAVGVSVGEITISQRVDSGGSTRFQARTKSGQAYNCSIGVVVSVLGRQVTDAICTRHGEAARNPLLR